MSYILYSSGRIFKTPQTNDFIIFNNYIETLIGESGKLLGD